MILDAKNLIVGRMGTFVAKQALLGETIDIVNCEKAVIVGKKEEVLERYKHKREMGTHAKGPFTDRNPAKMVRRIIRGMLPHKQYKGEIAFKRIKCHVGVPNFFQGKKAETYKPADISKIKHLKYVYINDISKFMGYK